jgi:hypothetical protein
MRTTLLVLAIILGSACTDSPREPSDTSADESALVDPTTWCWVPAITLRETARWLAQSYCHPAEAACPPMILARFCPTAESCVRELGGLNDCTLFRYCSDGTSYDDLAPVCDLLFGVGPGV